MKNKVYAQVQITVRIGDNEYMWNGSNVSDTVNLQAPASSMTSAFVGGAFMNVLEDLKDQLPIVIAEAEAKKAAEEAAETAEND